MTLTNEEERMKNTPNHIEPFTDISQLIHFFIDLYLKIYLYINSCKSS